MSAQSSLLDSYHNIALTQREKDAESTKSLFKNRIQSQIPISTLGDSTVMNLDVLDKVVLARSVLNHWIDLTRRYAEERLTECVLVEAIPDEEAHVEDDGSLTLLVRPSKDKTLSMRVESTEWAWIETIVL